MAYNSGEFQIIDSNGSNLQVAAAYGIAAFGNKMYVVYNPDGATNQDNGHCNFQQTVLNLSNVSAEDGSEKKSGAWETSSLAIQYACSDSTMALVPSGSNLYLFWKQVNTNGVVNILAAAVFNGASWSSNQITLQSMNGANLWPRNSDPIGVCAAALGDDCILVACASVSLGGTGYDDDNSGVYIGCYRTADLTGTTWAPVWEWLDPKAAYGIDTRLVSIDWFPIVSTGGTPGQSVSPVWVMGAWVSSTDQSGISVMSFYQFDETGIKDTIYRSAEHGLLSYRCDPAGRLTFCIVPEFGTSTYLAFGTYSGAQIPSVPFPGGDTMPPRQDIWLSQRPGWAPSVAYPITLPFGDSNDQYPAYLFLVYSCWDQNLYCQISRYGTIQKMETTKSLQPQNGSVIYAIQGIIDGPIPFPNENVSGTTVKVWGGEVTYGKALTEQGSHQISSNLTLGFQSEGKTSEGFGPAWSISLSHGSGQVAGSTQELTIESPFVASSWVESGSAINPNGFLCCVEMEVQAISYLFLDNSGAQVTDTTIPATIRAIPKGQPLVNYTPYAVTPGELATYTPDAWNSRMQQLGYTAAGPDGSVNYFRDIITKNAYQFLDAYGNPQLWLDCSWASGGSTPPSYENSSSSFTEATWSLSGDVYAGFSGGGGIDIFGEGEKMEFSALVGLSYEQESISSQETTNTWQISVDKYDVPDGDAVDSYSWRLYYLLPPAGNPYVWTAELCSNAGVAGLDASQIDPNSGAWRIVYVVTDIVYKDGRPAYHYDGRWDPQAELLAVAAG